MKHFFHYQFSKRNGKYFDTFNHSYNKKSSNRTKYIAKIYNDHQSAGINVQLPQNATTPRRIIQNVPSPKLLVVLSSKTSSMARP